MQTKGRIFDDIARVANGAAGTFSGMRREVEGIVKSRMERMLSDMDLVTRDEFDTVKDVAAQARLEQEALAERVAALEAEVSRLRQGGAPSKTAKAPQKKARAKKAGAKKGAAKKAAAAESAAKTTTGKQSGAATPSSGPSGGGSEG